MSSEFEIGDEVYCVIFGKGVVVEKQLEFEYSIEVEFDNGLSLSMVQA